MNTWLYVGLFMGYTVQYMLISFSALAFSKMTVQINRANGASGGNGRTTAQIHCVSLEDT